MTLYIFLFLAISFGYSLFEKLKDKHGYTLFLANHLKNKKSANIFWWMLVFINGITTAFLLISIISILFDVPLVSNILVFKICATTILILLFGQRIAGDFQGAANLGIYMILIILGWYLSTH